MEYLPLIGTVALAHLLAVISPGPDFFMAVRNSLTYSRKAGIYTALGFGMGIAVHIFYSIAGLAWLIAKSVFVFNLIKLAGALYLIYIGIQSLRSKSIRLSGETYKKEKEISPLQAVRMGFLTNVLNPKASLFFLSLFTLVISPSTPVSILGIVSIIMIVNTVLWFSLVSFLFTHRHFKKIYERFQKPINRFFGIVLILLGLELISSK